MSDYPNQNTPFKTVGLREICEVNGHVFSRKRGEQQWIEREGMTQSLPPSTSEDVYLSLVHHEQGLGEPRHWCLFVAPEGQPGQVYEVTGDAEYMIYQPSREPVNVTESADFLTLYQLAVVTEQQALFVKQVADNEPPPQAPNRQSVTENCQGWAVRVITKLVERGIVPSSKLDMARSMMQPG